MKESEPAVMAEAAFVFSRKILYRSPPHLLPSSSTAYGTKNYFWNPFFVKLTAVTWDREERCSDHCHGGFSRK